MQNLNTLAREIHKNAVEKGWWKEERPFYELIDLIHSEPSEALEEYRDDRPNVWYACKAANGMPCHENGCGDWRDGVCELQSLSSKPEGVAVELGDTVIRILDYCGKEEVDIEALLEITYIQDDTCTLPKLIAECHYMISQAYRSEDARWRYFARCINLIQFWCERNGIDLYEVIRMKHEYNKTRPYRHGGKKC